MKLEKLMEGWRRFVNENTGKPEYTAYVVPEEERGKLVSQLQNFSDKLEKTEGSVWKDSDVSAVHGNEQLNHHITINLGAAKEEVKPKLGQKVSVVINGFGVLVGEVKGKKTGVAAWRVDPSSLPVPKKDGIPHITAAIKRGDGLDSKPMHSNSITEWQDISPFNIECVIEEVFAKGKV